MSDETPTTMTIVQFDDWVLGEYQRIIAGAGKDGLKRTEAVDQIVQIIAKDQADKKKARVPVDLAGMVERAVHVRDESARRSATDDMSIVADCARENTILGKQDPIMDRVALCGSGLRKAWRHVGIMDVEAMRGVKHQHAADSAASANDFHKESTAVVTALLAHGNDATIGDLAS